MWKTLKDEVPQEGQKVLCVNPSGAIVEAVRNKYFAGGFCVQHHFFENQVFAVECVLWTEKPEFNE